MKDEPGTSPTHFMGMKTFTLAIVVAAMIVSGCAKVQRTAPPYYGPTQTMAQVVQQINANNAKITTLRAAHSFEATLVDDKGKSRSFSGDGYLLYTKPDNLLLTAGGIIKYFEIGSNDNQYWFTAYPDEVSTQWWGDKSNFTEAAARQIPIRPDLILEVLGVSEIDTNFLQPPVPVMRFNNDTRAYMFTWNRPLTNRWVAEKEVWYDLETKLPKLILLFDANGRIILRAYLSDHKQIPETGGMIATRYELFFPENKSQMSFHITDLHAYIIKGKIKIPNPGSFAFPQEPGVKKQIEIK
jgi:outer membrane lipoprotein-sorting protein